MTFPIRLYAFHTGTDSHHVSLKGSKECVELAKKRILEIVHDLESQVTIDCVIPQRHHRVVMGPRGSKVIVSISMCTIFPFLI